LKATKWRPKENENLLTPFAILQVDVAAKSGEAGIKFPMFPARLKCVRSCIRYQIWLRYPYRFGWERKGWQKHGSARIENLENT
jgi:hypothetical protein